MLYWRLQKNGIDFKKGLRIGIYGSSFDPHSYKKIVAQTMAVVCATNLSIFCRFKIKFNHNNASNLCYMINKVLYLFITNLYTIKTKISKISVEKAGKILSFGTYTLQKELISAWNTRHIKILLAAL